MIVEKLYLAAVRPWTRPTGGRGTVSSQTSRPVSAFLRRTAGDRHSFDWHPPSSEDAQCGVIPRQHVVGCSREDSCFRLSSYGSESGTGSLEEKNHGASSTAGARGASPGAT
jgi:hypothetical protein